LRRLRFRMAAGQFAFRVRRAWEQGRKGNTRSSRNAHQKREIKIVCEDSAKVIYSKTVSAIF
jgi:hypothetical protein